MTYIGKEQKRNKISFFFSHSGNRIKTAKGRVWLHFINDVPGIPCSDGSLMNQKLPYDVGRGSMGS